MKKIFALCLCVLKRLWMNTKNINALKNISTTRTKRHGTEGHARVSIYFTKEYRKCQHCTKLPGVDLEYFTTYVSPCLWFFWSWFFICSEKTGNILTSRLIHKIMHTDPNRVDVPLNYKVHLGAKVLVEYVPIISFTLLEWKTSNREKFAGNFFGQDLVTKSCEHMFKFFPWSTELAVIVRKKYSQSKIF